jgi:hypothetical protein
MDNASLVAILHSTGDLVRILRRITLAKVPITDDTIKQLSACIHLSDYMVLMSVLYNLV